MLPQGAHGPAGGEPGQQQPGQQQGERGHAPLLAAAVSTVESPPSQARLHRSRQERDTPCRPSLPVAGAAGAFIVAQQAPQIVLTSGGQPVLPLARSGGSGLPLASSGGSGIPLHGSGGSGIDPAFLQHYATMAAQLGLAGSGGSGIPLAGAVSLPEQQFVLAGGGGWPDAGAAALAGGSMSLPLMQPGGAYGGAAAAATKATRGRKARPYKHPSQVQEEKKKKAEVQVRWRVVR